MNWGKKDVGDIDIVVVLTGDSRPWDQRMGCSLLTEHLSTGSQPPDPTRLCGEGLMFTTLQVAPQERDSNLVGL